MRRFCERLCLGESRGHTQTRHQRGAPTRRLGWGSDTALYTSRVDFEERFPARLAEHGTLVVKQGRGNGGLGVRKVELLAPADPDVGPDDLIRVHDAQVRDDSWDADFLYGPKDADGEDTYVLCEVNVSAVWPFPPMASTTAAVAALARAQATRALR